MAKTWSESKPFKPSKSVPPQAKQKEPEESTPDKSVTRVPLGKFLAEQIVQIPNEVLMEMCGLTSLDRSHFEDEKSYVELVNGKFSKAVLVDPGEPRATPTPDEDE